MSEEIVVKEEIIVKEEIVVVKEELLEEIIIVVKEPSKQEIILDVVSNIEVKVEEEVKKVKELSWFQKYFSCFPK